MMRAWVLKHGNKYWDSLAEKPSRLNMATLWPTKGAAIDEGQEFTFNNNLEYEPVRVEIKEIK